MASEKSGIIIIINNFVSLTCVVGKSVRVGQECRQTSAELHIVSFMLGGMQATPLQLAVTFVPKDVTFGSKKTASQGTGVVRVNVNNTVNIIAMCFRVLFI
jgi:hypothetical protein